MRWYGIIKKKKLLPTGWYWWLDTNAHTNSFEFSVNSTIYTNNCIDLNWCFFTNVCAAFFTYRTRNFSSTHFTINSKILWTCVCVCAASVDTSYKNALRHASIFSPRKFNSKRNIYSAACLYNKISLFLGAKPFSERNKMFSFYKVYKVLSTGLDSVLNTYCLDDFGFLGYSKKFPISIISISKTCDWHRMGIHFRYNSHKNFPCKAFRILFFR